MGSGLRGGSWEEGRSGGLWIDHSGVDQADGSGTVERWWDEDLLK